MMTSTVAVAQNFIYRTASAHIVAGTRQQAGGLCPIYESSYIKICNSEIELVL